MLPREGRYLLLGALAIGLLVFVEATAPRPVDWTPTLERDDTLPYGTRVLFEQLPAVVAAPVRAVVLPPFVALRDTTRAPATYLFLALRFAPDAAEAGALLRYAARGGTVFAAAQAFDGPFADSLRLATAYRWDLPDGGLVPDSVGVNFTSPSLRAARPFAFGRGVAQAYFSRFDTSRALVLGLDEARNVNLLRVPVGSGEVVVSTLPHAFTNVHVLDPATRDYAFRALAYLPRQAVWWDEHHKPLRVEAGTPLRYVLAQPALRWAYYVALAGVLLLVLFEARRRQRPIPVVPPPANTSVEFVETVGRLYYQHGNHADLAAKKITYLLDYLRTHLRLPTDRLDEALAARVAERAAVPLEQVHALFAAVRAAQAQPTLGEEDLRRLAAHVDRFYQTTRR